MGFERGRFCVKVVVMPTDDAAPAAVFTEAFEALGIRANDAMVLRYIAAHPGLSSRKIGAALGISHSTVHRIGKQYAAAGIIYDMHGGGVQKYHLSPQGLLSAAERYLDQILNPGADTESPGKDRGGE